MGKDPIKVFYRNSIHISTDVVTHTTHKAIAVFPGLPPPYAQRIHSGLWITERLFPVIGFVRIVKTGIKEGSIVKGLSNESLIETYFKAIDLELEDEFIKLLEQEIERRKLELELERNDNYQLH
jgi:developmental checkpoint coupling sporulation initiation to replication initiation